MFERKRSEDKLMKWRLGYESEKKTFTWSSMTKQHILTHWLQWPWYLFWMTVLERNNAEVVTSEWEDPPCPPASLMPWSPHTSTKYFNPCGGHHPLVHNQGRHFLHPYDKNDLLLKSKTDRRSLKQVSRLKKLKSWEKVKEVERTDLKTSSSWKLRYFTDLKTCKKIII